MTAGQLECEIVIYMQLKNLFLRNQDHLLGPMKLEHGELELT